MSKRTKAKPTRRNVEKSPEKSPAVVPLDSRGQPLKGVAVAPEMRGRGPAIGAPNAGRPRNADRQRLRDIIIGRGAEAAEAVITGQPDASGKLPDFDQRLRWFCEVADIGFNKDVEVAKARAEAAAAANAGAKAQAGVQLILQGGPAGNLQTEPSSNTSS